MTTVDGEIHLGVLVVDNIFNVLGIRVRQGDTTVLNRVISMKTEGGQAYVNLWQSYLLHEICRPQDRICWGEG